MEDENSKRVFEIIDEMYQIFKLRKVDSNVMQILVKAGQALNDDQPAEIVAAKTVNGITLWTLSTKLNLGKEYDHKVLDMINELTRIARSGPYQWSYGVGNLRVQFW
ncbi:MULTISPECIES: hypothetical protein [unclassified Companilactobacillus]|uniref:hypothetical protein n=1 Tax=unclassified Companilactobacillus TaxID=2767904 RepID=UPI002FEF8EF4